MQFNIDYYGIMAEPPRNGQPPNNGQIARPHSVHCSEVPLYISQEVELLVASVKGLEKRVLSLLQHNVDINTTTIVSTYVVLCNNVYIPISTKT